MEHTIEIVNGTGTKNLISDKYNVTAKVNGYNNSTITPTQVNITDNVSTYIFKIKAEGTLTLHVTDNGQSSGTPIVGATFKRTDSLGNEYGALLSSDQSGNVTINNVPYNTNGETIKVYYKQLSSDEEHTFSTENQSITLTTEETTLEITNPPATTRTFNLTDEIYNIPIETGSLTLTKTD